MAAKQSTASTQANNANLNAIALLKSDHRKVNALFRKFKSVESADEKQRLVKEICTELVVHTQLEEEIFYPACREASVEDSALDEAQVEHDSAKLLIAALLRHRPDSPFYDAQVNVLGEYIKHHVGEEENPGSGIFAKARAAKLDMKALGQRLQERKEELMQQAETGSMSPSAARSLDLGSILNNGKQEQSTMARQNDRDRDGQGRFMGDEDNRNGGRGGWFGDSEGHSRAAQEGWESRGGGRSSSRDDDDDDRGGRGRGSRESGGRGGWFGDSEGHSRAAQEGWDSRGGGRSSRDDEDDDRGGRGRGGRGSSGDEQRGWFGDPRGHAEAARRGWQNR